MLAMPRKITKNTKPHTKQTETLIDKENLNETQPSFFHRIFLLVSPTSFLLSGLLPNSSPECLLGSSPTLILELPLIPLVATGTTSVTEEASAVQSLGCHAFFSSAEALFAIPGCEVPLLRFILRALSAPPTYMLS